RYRAALGLDSGPSRTGSVLAPPGGGNDSDDLLLRGDQPDDGHRYGACGRYPAAVHEPRRIVDDDQHDLSRHADDGGEVDPQGRPFGPGHLTPPFSAPRQPLYGPLPRFAGSMAEI